MRQQKLIILPGLLCGLSLLLGGCESETSSGTASGISEKLITITGDNSVEVTAEAMGSSFAANHAAARGASGSHSNTFINARLQQLIKQISESGQRRSGLLAVDTIQEFSEACQESGSKAFTYNIDTDAFSVQYQQCVEYGETSNGSASGSFVDDRFTITFNNLSVSSSDFSMAVNGTVSYTENDAGDYTQTVLSSSSYSASLTYLGRTMTIYDMQLTERDYDAAGYSAADFSFSADSKALGGTFYLQTTQTEFQNYNSERPYAGQYLITGANGSSLRMTVEDTDSLLLETDSDGDGVFESSTSISYTELEKLILG